MSRYQELFSPSKNLDLIACDASGKIHMPSRIILRHAGPELLKIVCDRRDVAPRTIAVYADRLELYGDRAAKLFDICGQDIGKVAVVILSGRHGTDKDMIRMATDHNHPAALGMRFLLSRMQQFIKPDVMKAWGVVGVAPERTDTLTGRRRSREPSPK